MKKFWFWDDGPAGGWMGDSEPTAGYADGGEAEPYYLASEVDRRTDDLETALKSASVVIQQQLKAGENFANYGKQALAEIDRVLSL
jgi:hypothetical protein